MKKGREVLTNGLKAGDDLIVTKWIALEGTSIIAKEKEADLKKALPEELVDTAKRFDQYLSVLPESRIAVAHGVSAMHDITEGGILGALWEFGEGAGVGLDVELRQIPIRQESVEICERYGLNPYQLMSSGSMLIGTTRGAALVRRLREAGIPAVLIGQTTKGRDRILRNGEEIRYLDRPQSDELYRLP